MTDTSSSSESHQQRFQREYAAASTDQERHFAMIDNVIRIVVAAQARTMDAEQAAKDIARLRELRETDATVATAERQRLMTQINALHHELRDLHGLVHDIESRPVLSWTPARWQVIETLMEQVPLLLHDVERLKAQIEGLTPPSGAPLGVADARD